MVHASRVDGGQVRHTAPKALRSQVVLPYHRPHPTPPWQPEPGIHPIGQAPRPKSPCTPLIIIVVADACVWAGALPGGKMSYGAYFHSANFSFPTGFALLVGGIAYLQTVTGRPATGTREISTAEYNATPVVYLKHPDQHPTRLPKVGVALLRPCAHRMRATGARRALCTSVW